MASSPAAAGQGQGQDVVFIPATSPMFRYAPYRNGPVGSAWLQIDGGGSACAGPSTFAVEIDSLYCEYFYLIDVHAFMYIFMEVSIWSGS